jgi:mannose-6-phosphate isomerase-like protein (cupin superfamily)
VGVDGYDTAITDDAPIVGAAGITITYAVCPPGQGPGLHAHMGTFETFTVMRGRFLFRYGDLGQHEIEAGEFDTLSFPPRVHRCFANVGDDDGILQVIISGGAHDMFDIHVNAETTRKLLELSPELHAELAATGVTFAGA